MCGGPISLDEKTKPTIHIPMQKKQLQSLSVGDVIEVTVKGKVTALRLNEGEHSWDNSKEVQLEISKVTLPEDNPFAKMAKDED